MRLRRMLIGACLCISLTVSQVSRSAATTTPATLEPTQVFRIVPKFGYAASSIRIRFSRSEIQITNRLQRLATTWVPSLPVQPLPVQFLVEPSAETSTTVQLAKQAMEKVASLLVRPNDSRPTRTYIIIGRTQDFLQSTMQRVGCFPDLAPIGGELLMGATLCDRQVIAINLTGYLFLRSRGQQLTPEMETRPEPPIAATSYLIADRNITSLAHEWAHVARALISRGFIPDNEPAWMREGLAEVISGMAHVKASQGRMTYRDFHAIRLRKFVQWPSSCRLPTSNYRATSSALGGCEYHRGALAVELLIANYGGLDKVISLYDNASQTGDFFLSFRNVYGMSISTFEEKVDRYSNYVSLAATYSKSK